MDFDEYDYLEKTVENPVMKKVKETANGGDGSLKLEEKDRNRVTKHRSDMKDDVNDDHHRSKHSKSREDSHDNSIKKERGSSRHRSRSRDGERDRHRNGREHRDRDKGRDKEERNERDRDRDRERIRDRDSERERERDKETEKERTHRSSSRTEQLRSKDGERIRDKEFRERDREKELKERGRESRRHKDKKEEGGEPEVDPERDQRTVFVYQIHLKADERDVYEFFSRAGKADERDVYEFFSRAGKVRDVRLIMDRNSRRSKGVGYVEFYDAMSVPMAIALSGQLLRGQPVMVKPSEAEKNLVQSTATAAAGVGGLTGPYSGGARRLYVGNLHFNITEDQLRQVFEPFGTVELVQLPADETGHCKGFGFVQFARLEDARNAVNLNGQVEIAGRAIKVSAVTDQTGIQDGTTNTGDFDDDEGGGLSLNARSRALLMQKLDRSGTATSSLGITAVNSGVALPAVPILGTAPAVSSASAPLLPGSVPITTLPGSGLQLPGATTPIINTIGIPSECLLLKNMFDPNLEMEPDFDLDIKDDVKDECSKFGTLKHIFVDKNSAGFVYLRFENAQAAVSAQRALHGRWFAGKMITATFMVPQTYEAKFPDSQ